MRVGMVAGEASGDLLASSLMQALAVKCPAVEFEGIAGPKMEAQGCRALVASERLAVMGLTEVLGRLPELLRIRADIVRHFSARRPAVFVGVDAPDFNLTLERKLKERGIRTVHFVSPSVWAWRQYRVRKIARSVDLMLCLFPFEQKFYEQHHVSVRYVGHPLADTIPLETDTHAARARLGLPVDAEVIAILPGSRAMEVTNLAPDFIRTAAWLLQRRPGLCFVTPLVNSKTRAIFEAALRTHGAGLPFMLLDGQSHDAMAAADAVLLASGTAALEAMLLKKPMVVAYRVSRLSEFLLRRLIRVPYYSLPNLLAEERLIDEFVQRDVTPENLGDALLQYFEAPHKAWDLRERFVGIHLALRRDAATQAATAILELAQR